MGISIQTIRKSFEALRPRLDLAAQRLVDDFFADEPEAAALVHNMHPSAYRLILTDALANIVEQLDQPERLAQFLIQLGERAARFGFQEHHCNWLRVTLLKTLCGASGPEWHGDLEAQWSLVCAITADAMRVGVNKQTVQNPAMAPTPRPNPPSAPTKPLNGFDLNAFLTDAALPDDIRHHIRCSVNSVVQHLIQAEVKRCFADQMRRIAQLSPEDLVKEVI